MKSVFTYILLLVFGWNCLQPQYHVECKPVEKSKSCCASEIKETEKKCHSQTEDTSGMCSQCNHKILVSLIYFKINEEYNIENQNIFFISKNKFFYKIEELSFAEISIWQPPKIS